MVLTVTGEIGIKVFRATEFLVQCPDRGELDTFKDESMGLVDGHRHIYPQSPRR